jgi:preprotein translocase subunit YajC
MIKLSAIGLMLLVFAVSSTSIAHNQDRTNSKTKMFPFQLLPGYKVFSGSGIDSSSATIWRDGGITIELSQGLYVGVDVDSIQTEDVAWR